MREEGWEEGGEGVRVGREGRVRDERGGKGIWRKEGGMVVAVGNGKKRRGEGERRK